MKKIAIHNHPRQSDLDPQNCRTIAAAINPLLANTFALYVKTKSFHWHITGKNFRDYHLLLDEHSAEILAMIDVLAERVRKLGEKTIHSIGQIKELQSIKDVNEALSAEEMLQNLLQDNKEFLSQLREVHEVSSKGNDVATTSLLENYIDETEKRIWFLFQTLN